MQLKAVCVGVAAAFIAALLPGQGVAAPAPSFVAHRGTSGGNDPAPLYVHFDATATTSSLSGDDPFMDLFYEWDFGDPQSGNWATNGLPRNKAFGGVAAHVYERPGSYTVTLTVSDRTGAKQTTTRTVVVDNPDQFWATTTACVSSSGNFAGCPASGAALLTSSDFTAAMQNRVNAGFRRILFRRGERFVANSCWFTPNQRTEALVSAFGTGAQPVIEISPSNTNCAITLAGSSVNSATSGGWRFVDLRISSPSATNPARGIATSFIFDDLLLYKMDIGPTGFGFNFGPDQSGLNVPHKHYAVVDTQLRGNTGTPVSNPGSCWFGGADKTFISGVVCGQANAWQMRIAYTNKAVISNNVVSQTAGAFESIKFHCSIGPIAADPGVICANMIFSDNVLAKARLNIAAGGNDEGTIQRSIFERNMVNGAIEIENPNNMIRNNVSSAITLKPRARDASNPRGNQFVNNTCDRRVLQTPCVRVLNGVRVDGLVLRNNLQVTPATPSPPMLQNEGGTGTITQQGNISTNVNPWVVANPNPIVRADYALRTDAVSLIDKGVALKSLGLDLLGRPFPQGSAPDVGAFESGSGAVSVDGPPAPPVLLSVDVQP